MIKKNAGKTLHSAIKSALCSGKKDISSLQVSVIFSPTAEH
jgi:hypothetical protein